MSFSRQRGLYAITDEHLLAGRLLVAVEQALIGGARAVQYRRKSGSSDERRCEATALLALCRRYHIPLFINDDVTLALTIGADGVHLGRSDTPLSQARSQLGKRALMGATCHDKLQYAKEAAKAGADYLAFGAVFPSPTKPHICQAPLSLFQDARCFGLPLVAIGGINTDNAPLLIDAGVDYLAVIHALWTAPDITQRAQQFSSLFT
jgi:thiamine-phosphate pyrophosphorylase